MQIGRSIIMALTKASKHSFGCSPVLYLCVHRIVKTVYIYIPPRFSGVTEEDLENTTISLRDVQAVLLSMFSAESILIGHSLESDLLALKVPWLFIHLQDFLFHVFPLQAVNECGFKLFGETAK